ncbi:MAG: aminotransferase class I/II-fold pyridoxal phosphate-dependent enzyme [Leptolyngbya sp.]|nr:aminotransferase class I/II-fold pyridoxal phosphate-dependent enzyme [Candidatus Melainabacteria bacterium]
MHNKKVSNDLLADMISAVVVNERASFHTPGHKTRPSSFGKSENFRLQLSQDVTELPGLDDLNNPTGVLLNLEKNLAILFGAKQTSLSVNGASVALIAAFIACAQFGKKALIPRNLHRAAVSGICLSLLEPIWHEPLWNSEYGFYEGADAQQIEKILQNENDIACVLVVSPTYQGAISDISAISAVCCKYDVTLIVDEAHGAHLFEAAGFRPSALSQGADLVVHSFHKTLSALTQTGALHLGYNSKIGEEQLRAVLNTLQSSSPNYLLMTSVELMLSHLSTSKGMEQLNNVRLLAEKIRTTLVGLNLYSTFTSNGDNEPYHIVIRANAEIDLASELRSRGIGIEADFDGAILLLLGAGTTEEDVQTLLSALEDIQSKTKFTPNSLAVTAPSKLSPPEINLAMSPASALRAASRVVDRLDALGQISAECIAPCPPGVPVVIPGQFIDEYVLNITGIRSIRVIEKL